MNTKRKCVVCDARPAELPDRNRMGRPIKRVCRECHAARLRGDLVHILRVKREREARIGSCQQQPCRSLYKDFRIGLIQESMYLLRPLRDY